MKKKYLKYLEKVDKLTAKVKAMEEVVEKMENDNNFFYWTCIDFDVHTAAEWIILGVNNKDSDWYAPFPEHRQRLYEAYGPHTHEEWENELQEHLADLDAREEILREKEEKLAERERALAAMEQGREDCFGDLGRPGAVPAEEPEEELPFQ